MPEKLFSILERMELPYFRQGTLESSNDYLPSFFTFWNIDTPTASFYNDGRNGRIWVWAVYFYTNDARLIYSKLDEFIQLATEEGFIVQGEGKDIPSDRSDYFGRYVQLKYIDYKEN